MSVCVLGRMRSQPGGCSVSGTSPGRGVALLGDELSKSVLGWRRPLNTSLVHCLLLFLRTYEQQEHEVRDGTTATHDPWQQGSAGCISVSTTLADQLLAAVAPAASGEAQVALVQASQNLQFNWELSCMWQQIGILSGSSTFSAVVAGIEPSASFTTSGVLCSPVLSTAPQLLFPPPCCMQRPWSSLVSRVIRLSMIHAWPRTASTEFEIMAFYILEWHVKWHPLPSSQVQGRAECHDELHAAPQTPQT